MNTEQIVHKFRRALGGFNRQDVMAYIAQTDAAWKEKLDAREQELTALRSLREELEAALQGLRSENGTVSAEEAKTRASLEESTRALARVRGELTQAETRLAVAKKDLARLQAQVDQLEPMAKNYQDLKDRVAVIDLEAHKQARQIVDEAQAQAEDLRRQGRQWVEGLLEQYDRLRQSAGELDGRLAELSQLSAALLEGDEAARRLRAWGEPETAEAQK